MDATFHLKKNTQPSNFITKVTFRACGLAPIRDSEVVFTASLLTIVLPPIGEVKLELTSYPSSGLSLVKAAILT